MIKIKKTILSLGLLALLCGCGKHDDEKIYAINDIDSLALFIDSYYSGNNFGNKLMPDHNINNYNVAYTVDTLTNIKYPESYPINGYFDDNIREQLIINDNEAYSSADTYIFGYKNDTSTYTRQKIYSYSNDETMTNYYDLNLQTDYINNQGVTIDHDEKNTYKKTIYSDIDRYNSDRSMFSKDRIPKILFSYYIGASIDQSNGLKINYASEFNELYVSTSSNMVTFSFKTDHISQYGDYKEKVSIYAHGKINLETFTLTFDTSEIIYVNNNYFEKYENYYRYELKQDRFEILFDVKKDYEIINN